MNKDEVQNLVKLRQFVIDEYRSLDGAREPAAMIRQTDVARTYETIVKSLDDLIKEYVTFQDGR